ncbi:MAG: hypothetical protein BRD57_02800 [Proteobacteria bacterium SW_6_67_9]|nr:MAG: hypothetical protein BRD57_02800 [Proteobacteria bacterium SW_6_67_9]
MRPTRRTRLLRLGPQLKEGMQSLQRLSRPGVGPDLLIVGRQQAGTTSPFDYLDARPGFAGAQRKELRFLKHDDRYACGEA